MSPSLCPRLVSPMWTHMALLWTILPMNASEGISLSRCERQSYCLCWVRKILSVARPRLSNTTDGTTVLHSAPSYLSTHLASISCMFHCVPQGMAPSQEKTCQSESAWRERRARPCSLRRGEAAHAMGAQIPMRMVLTSVRDFCVVLIACQQMCRRWTSSRTGRWATHLSESAQET